MDAGLLLVMSDNLRQAKTCFCEPQGPLQHRHSAGAAISAVHLRTVPEGLRIIVFYFELCSVQNEAKITNHFKGWPNTPLRDPSR
jgi:hypothetical protein